MAIPLPLARRDAIAGRLAAGAAVVAGELAVEFDVSEDAVRRDLRALAAAGLCRRVYGGALPAEGAPRPLSVRIDEARDRKRALARRAAASIAPGEFLFLDAGSANLALVEFLPAGAALTVATNSIAIAAAVLPRPDLRLILVGGTVDPLVGGCIDAAAVQAVAGLVVDRCFLGACAVDAGRGIGAEVHADAVFKRAALGAARHCVVMATNEKFGARALHRLGALADLALLVVEHDAPATRLRALRAAGAPVARAARADRKDAA
jgi:DeoR/GlpR family transcriptional regulator of sugar metabolism